LRCAREPGPTVLMTTSFALHDPNATSAEGPSRHFCHVAHFRFRGKRTSFTKVNSAAASGSRSNRAAKRPLDRAPHAVYRHFGSSVTLSLAAWPKTFALSSQLLKPRRRPWRKRSSGSRPASRRRSVRRSQPSSGWLTNPIPWRGSGFGVLAGARQSLGNKMLFQRSGSPIRLRRNPARAGTARGLFPLNKCISFKCISFEDRLT
jgi:hypothetical protein